MDNIDHIGIAVKSISQASPVFQKLLGALSYKKEEVITEGVITAFFKVGTQKIELLEATSPNSHIAGFLEKRGEGIHHIAFLVDDIYAEMKRLKSEGFTLLSDKPKPGADNKLICFVHPKETCGVLIELCQEVNA